MKMSGMNISRLGLITALSVSLFLVWGCKDDRGGRKIDKVQILDGASQCALPGETFARELRVELLSPPVPGFFGGAGDPDPVPGVRVAFEPLDGSDLKVIPQSAKTDSGGEVRVKVVAGQKIGDQYLRVIPLDAPEKGRTVRFVTGMRIGGSGQEAFSGSYLDEPLEVRLVGSDGKPARGVPVFFKLASSPEKKSKAALSSNSVVTDADGVAQVKFKVGEATGTYRIEVEVAGEHQNIHIRAFEIKEMGLNVWTLIVTVFGGLSLFVFGMKKMSDGLQMIAGEKMKTILHFFTSNRFVAVLAGTIITAVIQSSSACTVMVVGFVNAGLLNLTQSIGIIFGANIGTTVTAQIISFNLSGLAMPAIIVGMLTSMLAKSNSTKGWGDTIFGFGLLFFGMTLMGNELKLIGTFPAFINFFKTFDCSPVNGYMPLGAVVGSITIGILMTVLVQSSSASMGVVLALSGSGLINFFTAVPLLLGTNIGTTITAILAAIPANRRAKQAAVAHVLFNLLGSAYMIILLYVPWKNTDIPVFLYIVNDSTAGDVFAAVPQNVTRHIAMAHTLFNVFNVIIFLPFIGTIAKICNFVIPVKNESDVIITALDMNLLKTPSVAIEQVIETLRHMVKESWGMVNDTVNNNFLGGKSTDRDFVDLEKREDRIDELQAEITKYLVQLTRRELTPPQSDLVPLLMHCTNDAERIADHSCAIFKLSRRLDDSENKLSPEGINDISRLWLLLADQAENVMAALHNADKDKLITAFKDEMRIDELAEELEKSHIKRLKQGDCDAATGIIFIEMLAELERIGDHLNNIAERTPEIQKHYFEMG